MAKRKDRDTIQKNISFKLYNPKEMELYNWLLEQGGEENFNAVVIYYLHLAKYLTTNQANIIVNVGIPGVQQQQYMVPMMPMMPTMVENQPQDAQDEGYEEEEDLEEEDIQFSGLGLVFDDDESEDEEEEDDD